MKCRTKLSIVNPVFSISDKTENGFAFEEYYNLLVSGCLLNKSNKFPVKKNEVIWYKVDTEPVTPHKLLLIFP